MVEFAQNSSLRPDSLALWAGVSEAVEASPEQLQREALQQSLLEAQESRPSSVVPIAVVVAGVAVGLAGIGLGAAEALPCKGSCRASVWAGPLAIGGLAVAVAGGVWLQWVHDWQQDAERREQYLQDRLALFEASQAP